MNLPLRALLLDQKGIVKTVDELANGVGLGRLIAQTAIEAGIVFEQSQIVVTVAAHGMNEHETFDELPFGVAATLQGKIGFDEAGEPKGAKSARDTQGARVSA